MSDKEFNPRESDRPPREEGWKEETEQIVKRVAQEDLSMQSDGFRMGFIHATGQINRMLGNVEGDPGSK